MPRPRGNGHVPSSPGPLQCSKPMWSAGCARHAAASIASCRARNRRWHHRCTLHLRSKPNLSWNTRSRSSLGLGFYRIAQPEKAQQPGYHARRARRHAPLRTRQWHVWALSLRTEWSCHPTKFAVVSLAQAVIRLSTAGAGHYGGSSRGSVSCPLHRAHSPVARWHSGSPAQHWRPPGVGAGMWRQLTRNMRQ